MIYKHMKSIFISTVWRKVFVGLTGLGLAIFILIHMSGNLLLFVGEESYNMYSHNLISNPLTLFCEIGLIIIFSIHILWALALALYNKNKKGLSKKDSNSLIHKTLWIQGIIILTFVILHLITFKFGAYYTAVYNGQEVRDLFRLVKEVFQKPLYVAWYLFSLSILFFHLNHGLQASLRSLGFYHQTYIQRTGLIYSLIVTAGFMAQPVYFLGGFVGI